MPARSQLELDLGLLLQRDPDARTTGCTGTLQVRCTGCGHEDGVRFACASQCRRCPWDSGRVAPILDILPRVPVRHFVVTLPEPWRQALVHDAAALRRVRNAVMQELVAMIERTAAPELPAVHGGGVCATHPCGSCLELNVHLHALVLDGVYAIGDDDEATFHPCVDDPDARTLGDLAHRIHHRIEQIAAPARTRSRDASAPRRVKVQQRLVTGPKLHRVSVSDGLARGQGRVADARGLRVRVGPVVDANDRAGVARLAGYLTRPMPAAHAFSRGTGESIRYRLLHPFADGTTHVEFAPAELAARLRELGPAGRASRITWHGVLAPHAANRRHVVPRQLELGEIVQVRRAAPRTRRKPAPIRAQPCPTCGQVMHVVGLEVGHR